jgi:hypothetical protein
MLDALPAMRPPIGSLPTAVQVEVPPYDRKSCSQVPSGPQRPSVSPLPPPVPAPRAGAPLFQPVALRVTSASSVDASAPAPSSGQGPDDDAATSAKARTDSAPTDAAVVREAPAEAAVGVSARGRRWYGASTRCSACSSTSAFPTALARHAW